MTLLSRKLFDSLQSHRFEISRPRAAEAVVLLAGDMTVHTGHHHLLINVDGIKDGEVILFLLDRQSSDGNAANAE